MSSNKHAVIRYRALDRCFKDFDGTYKLKDLIRICSEDIHAYESERQGKSIPFKLISKRTLLYDIEFMKSEYPGFEAPIANDRIDGYYYTDNQFELFKARMSKTDLEQFKDAIIILKNLSGKSQFKHLDSSISRIESTYNIKRGRNKIAPIQFEESSNIEGQKWISEVLEHIKNKTTLRVKYHPFDKDVYHRILSPYLIKEYNNRWFLICYDHDAKRITNIGLDRVKSIDSSIQEYIPDEYKKSIEYSKDIVGVSIPDDSEVETVVFKAKRILRHYIRTKPIHPTQEELEFNDEFGIFSIQVHSNYELKSKLLQHRENLEVLKPAKLREEFKSIVKAMHDVY